MTALVGNSPEKIGIALQCRLDAAAKLAMKSHQDEPCGRGASSFRGVKIRQSQTWLPVPCICVLCLPMCVRVRVCIRMCGGGALSRPAAGRKWSPLSVRMRRGEAQPQGERRASTPVWPTGVSVN